MNWQLIEHPTAARLAIARQADRCVKWLRAQGLEVRCIEKGPRTPLRIIISPSPLCDRFEGAVACYSRALDYSRTVQAEQRYKTVLRHGCEVRWEDPSTGSGQAGGAA